MGTMDLGPWVQSGRVFSAEEIASIRTTVAWLPGLARRELAATLCEHLDWYTLTGTPKLDACGELLVRLEAVGLLVLPAVRPAGHPRRVPRAAPQEAAETPLCPPLAALGPAHLEAVQWDAAVARWHPLGFKGAFGYRLRYFITAASSIWAVCCWPGPRERSWCATNGSGGENRGRAKLGETRGGEAGGEAGTDHGIRSQLAGNRGLPPFPSALLCTPAVWPRPGRAGQRAASPLPPAQALGQAAGCGPSPLWSSSKHAALIPPP